MRLEVTPTFDRTAKKLNRHQKMDLDEAVRAIADDPEIGVAKVGDLAGVRVYKFRLSNAQCLLAYRILAPDTLKLLTFGPHENFYRDLKRLDV
ncbi:type II toxin-antitoxin system RelE/ParE family toxin [Methylococcus mesophilus]|uniref:type II toxin-antitoxin system RelE/ParE family toxin n=1 Tax=Methylococcus mesophilus TaxID=2993564 RepID=UPI00224B5B95|nr:type II toxin-antitoxin system RelE/ParE family toxin [Methylococcus mesophilus]UZR28100.1 type II toxin-antitoxin system RelE/ParE family toxin [Methylococcus mesophilus]